MDTESFLRYALEFAMLLPAAAYALLPAGEELRVRPGVLIPVTAAALLAVICGAAALSLWLGWPSYIISCILLLLAYPVLLAASDLSWSKAVFCLANAAMLSAFVCMYTNFIMAPMESDAELTFTPLSSVVCLALAVVVGLVFFRTMNRKLPYLFRLENLDRAWSWLSLIPLALTGLMVWIATFRTADITAGRVRVLALALFPLIPIAVLALYHMFWWTAVQQNRTNALERQADLFRMEGKRYESLVSYMDETRAMRHDFRQHLAVVGSLARSGRTEELNTYLGQMEEDVSKGSGQMCANAAVDAIAAHYTSLAAAQKTHIDWTLELPAAVPLTESELCAVFGNLLENAMQAVAKLPEDKRRITAAARMVSPAIVGLSVTNPYEGKLTLNRSGLPVTRRKGHGIGLASVRNIVKKYNGTLDISVDNQIFSASVILYAQTA